MVVGFGSGDGGGGGSGRRWVSDVVHCVLSSLVLVNRPVEGSTR